MVGGRVRLGGKGLNTFTGEKRGVKEVGICEYQIIQE